MHHEARFRVNCKALHVLTCLAGLGIVAGAHLGALPQALEAYIAVVNTAGCACLLSSGWLSHRIVHAHEHSGDAHHH
jgi:hypothetical protein